MGDTIVMEVATGEVLAMVNLGRDARGNLSERVRNYAIGMTTEPGSTFKLASMLALLDDAGIPLDETYDTNDGRITRVGGIDVRDSHGGYREMDFPTAVARPRTSGSPKPCGPLCRPQERYGDYLRHLHLDRPVGLERSGEKTPTFERLESQCPTQTAC
ncbi:MAG: penicillin-binding transpeptidase domain-containing protein [Alistipes sp.]